MNIIGHEKSSFIDYPDKICTVFFTGGCNFRCPYCHNSSIVRNEGVPIDEDYIFRYLENRKKFLDGVCISGGEPTLHEDLCDFINKIKGRGFLVKLDTNGTNFEMLKELIDKKSLDYIAMDIKAPLDKYEFVTKTKVDIDSIKSSIDIIKASNVDYEFRTTVCKELLSKEDILEIAEYLKGSKKYAIQNFRDGETVLAGKKQFNPYDIKTLKEIDKKIKSYFATFMIRNW